MEMEEEYSGSEEGETVLELIKLTDTQTWQDVQEENG